MKGTCPTRVSSQADPPAAMASVWTDTHGQELVALRGLVSIPEIGSRLNGSSLAFAGRQVARRQTGGMFAAHQQTRHLLRFASRS